MKNKTVLEKQKELELQISKLQIELKELERKEGAVGFIKWLKDVLLDDNCYIVMQGHTEWQFQEKYLMKDIEFEYRKKIAKSLNEIIHENGKDKDLENPPIQKPTKPTIPIFPESPSHPRHNDYPRNRKERK